jgi:hypothetical protein
MGIQGFDIPDIKRVVQLGICQSIGEFPMQIPLPKSCSVIRRKHSDTFMQRIGCAWHGQGGKGEGWLIFEP